MTYIELMLKEKDLLEIRDKIRELGFAANVVNDTTITGIRNRDKIEVKVV